MIGSSSDYRAMVRPPKGGSRPGTDKRPIPPALKLAIHRWCLQEYAGGHEALFYRRLDGDSRPRFTPRVVAPLIPLLWNHFPAEMEAYLGPYVSRKGALLSERYEKAGHLIANRLHKMYYEHDGTRKIRGEGSREHPRNWTPEKRAAAEARLVEVGWPW